MLRECCQFRYIFAKRYVLLIFRGCSALSMYMLFIGDVLYAPVHIFKAEFCTTYLKNRYFSRTVNDRTIIRLASGSILIHPHEGHIFQLTNYEYFRSSTNDVLFDPNPICFLFFSVSFLPRLSGYKVCIFPGCG